jgi:hypothetical protein
MHTAGCGECSTLLLCSRCEATYNLHALPASPLSPSNVSVCLPALSPTAMLQLLGRSRRAAATEEVASVAADDPADWGAPLRLALSAMSGAASPSPAQAPFAQVRGLQSTRRRVLQETVAHSLPWPPTPLASSQGALSFVRAGAASGAAGRELKLR